MASPVGNVYLVSVLVSLLFRLVPLLICNIAELLYSLQRKEEVSHPGEDCFAFLCPKGTGPGKRRLCGVSLATRGEPL